MIGKLTGVVEEILQDYIILNVGGVGYIIHTTKKAAANLSIGNTAKFYIEQQIAENIIKLYGFISKKEQDILKILIQVKGINYKTAINLIDKLGANKVVQSIQQKNEFDLKVKGIGEKLIKRIITEVHADFLKIAADGIDLANNSNNYTESVSALCNLGFNQNICQNIVSEILKDDEALSVSDIIVLALKKL